MKAPSGECNGVIGAGDVSENKNVTTRLSCWCGPERVPIRSGHGRGLAILQKLLRPPCTAHQLTEVCERYRGISPWTCSSIFYLWGVRMAVWRCHRLIYSTATESSLHSRMLAPGKNDQGPVGCLGRLSRSSSCTAQTASTTSAGRLQ